jgi:diketogulonate reductase-like aldo/keto reductase
VTIRAKPIPGSGERVPVIGLGTWQSFDVGNTAAERTPREAVLREFVALGGSVIDSSPMYGRSETVVGDLVSTLGVRSRLFLATKVWTSGRREGSASMDESMRRMRADPIDLMQVHNLVDTATHLATMRALKAQGRIRYVGVTHYTDGSHDALVKLIATEALDFVQINYSAAERNAERRLLPAAAERGVAVIANRPLASGELLRMLRSKPLPAWIREHGCESWAEALLKFAVSHPAVTCAIPATSNVGHLRENMRAGEGAELTERERTRLVTDLL